jgi:hypothetical protein
MWHFILINAMPAGAFQKLTTRWRFRLVILLLQLPAVLLQATEQRLLPGHVPAQMTSGNVAPLGRVPGTNQLRLALSLPLRHTAELTNLLASLYRPGSPEYRHFLTPQAFTERFGPTPADYATVLEFARTNHLTITATHADRRLVDVTARVADVEAALHLKLYSFRHPTELRTFFAPDTEPTVNARIPLLHVSGLDNYALPKSSSRVRPASGGNQVTPSGGSSSYGSYMGNDFRLAYVPGTTLTGAGQNVGLLEFDGFDPADVTNYANTIGLTTNIPAQVVVPVNGGVAYPGAGSGEVTLDIEMVLAMSPGVSNIYVYEELNGAPWVDLISQMANDDLAEQLSCSWYGGGPDPAAEQYFLQMAAQGQTFFNATSDSGAFAGVVPFPCSSPNVTEVGGTSLDTDPNGNYLAESVWNLGGGRDKASCGGVCPGVGIPVWQLGLDLSTNGGSTTCRNVPDVALTADNIYAYAGGQPATTYGTSCAAPLWAGFMALVNQQAAQLGEPPVGFLNPALYALCRGTNYPALFHDITDGNNTNHYNPTNYYAAPGFDLCTGWGTPAGTNLINALTAADSLGLLPPVELTASGVTGGPFSQTNWTLTLTNTGARPVDWLLGNVPAWLAVAITNGTLPAQSGTNLALQLAAPETWPPADYAATLFLTNLDLSSIQNVLIDVQIGPSIVANGGFETGDFTGWTLAGDTVSGGLDQNVVAMELKHPGVVHSGFFGAYLAQAGFAATLAQTLPTTVGQQYLVSFWLNNPGAGDFQTFSVSWDGTNFINFTNPPAFAWTNYQFVAVAADPGVVLQFAVESDTGFFALDDVSVTPVPPLAFTSFGGTTNGFAVAWPSLAGLNYLVQSSTNLVSGGWQDVCQIMAATNHISCLDTNAGGDAQRFYRLQLAPSN